MLNALKFLLNPYDRKARLQPALLSALPLFVSLLLLIPEFGAVWGAVSGAILYCGGTTLLTQLGRGRGKALEPRLFREWDGKPSVAMLRNRDGRLSATDKARYRTYLGKAIPGLRLASERKERRSPRESDDGYQAATSWLLEQTRDRGRFELIFRENINYGFRRNFWALKSLAIGLDIVALAILVVVWMELWTQLTGSSALPTETTIVACAALVVAHALAFSLVVRSDWVRTVAEAYARQLLAACDQLDK